MVPLQVTLGFSQGVMPLISYNYSSGNRRRMKDTILFTLRSVIPVMTGVLILFSVGARPIIHAFMENEAIVEYGSRFLRGFCLSMPFICMDFVTVGVFQAIGWGRAALCFAILRKIVLEIPALIVLNALFPLYGLAYAQFTAEFVLAIAAVIMLRRIFARTAASEQHG